MKKWTIRKALLTLILILGSTNTMAEWTKVGESNDRGSYTIYADLDSIRQTDSKVKMWILLDYQDEQKASGTLFLSEKIWRQYDCTEAHMRVLSFKLFSWNMARGELLRSYPQPQKWQRIQPDSIDEAEWKVACNK